MFYIKDYIDTTSFSLLICLLLFLSLFLKKVTGSRAGAAPKPVLHLKKAINVRDREKVLVKFNIDFC